MPETLFYGAAALVLVAAWAIFYRLPGRPKRYRSPRPYRSGRTSIETRRFPRTSFSPASAVLTAEQQLRVVVSASFQRQRLLNAAEYRVFKTIEEEIASARRGFRVFAQTSLGEILASPNDDAFRSINSKRIDMLIVDRGGWPVVAVEYQGSGHYQGTAAIRDAVKKEALLKAGIQYLEIFANESSDKIRLLVREHLGLSSAGRPTTVDASSAST